MRAGRAVGVDHTFRQQVRNVIATWRDVSREKVIEAAVLTNENDDVLDGSASSTLLLRLNRAGKRATQSKLEDGHGHETDAQTVHGF